MNGAKEDEELWPLHLEDKLSYIGKASVSWAWPLIKLATTRPLQPQDIPPCPKSQNVVTISGRFWTAWRAEQARRAMYSDTRNVQFSLFRVIFSAYRGEFLAGYLSQLGFCVAQFALPYFIAELVEWISTGEGGLMHGLQLALILAVINLCSSVMMSFNLFTMRRTGLAVRTGTMMACYDQVLHLTAAARSTLTVGKTTSMIGIDCEKLMMASLFTGYLWHGPLASMVCMFLLVQDVGWAPAMAGMLWVCILIPLQTYVARGVGARRRLMMACTDERVKLSNEILGAIRSIKFYNWEVPLAARVLTARVNEIYHLFIYLCMNGLLRELLFISGPVCSVIVFTYYTYVLNERMTLVQVVRVLATGT